MIVSKWFQILFHSDHLSSFHLSLTVLVRYRSPSVFSLGGWSPRLPTGFLVSCGTPDPCPLVHISLIGAVTLSGCAFQRYSAICTSLFAGPYPIGP